MEAEPRLSDAYLVPTAQFVPLDTLPIDKGAVGTVQIADHKDPLQQIDGSMVPGSAFIGQVYVAAARAANAGALQQQRVSSCADLEPGRRLAGPRRLKGQIDVTDAQTITAIIPEKGIIEPPSAETIRRFFQ